MHIFNFFHKVFGSEFGRLVKSKNIFWCIWSCKHILYKYWCI